jgi:hypothetical protein
MAPDGFDLRKWFFDDKDFVIAQITKKNNAI